MVFKMLAIESSWIQYGSDVGVKPRQLFLTRSQHLADKVKESFTRLYRTHVLDSHDCRSDDDPSDSSPVQVGWVPDLPEKFSELTGDHFPLFLSYDSVGVFQFLVSTKSTGSCVSKLCSLIEKDLSLPQYMYWSLSSAAGTRQTRVLLTYEIFLSQYWASFPRYLTSNLGHLQEIYRI